MHTAPSQLPRTRETPVLRIVVLVLVVLAIGKVAALQWVHKTSSDDVIIAAYSQRALEACTADAARQALLADKGRWPVETNFYLEIGRRERGPAFWQVDDPGWQARFRNPHLHLAVRGGDARLACDYDVVKGTAAARRG